jgi:hypothetical protein
VLLTATGTAGALMYAGWAGLDRLWTLRPAARRRAAVHGPRAPVAPVARPAVDVGP